jgi:hypothetical protein
MRVKLSGSYLSTSDALRSLLIVLALASFRWKMLSITESSVLVVSDPQKAQKSFTTSPAAITSEPLFTVPAYLNKKTRGIMTLEFLNNRRVKILTTSGT